MKNLNFSGQFVNDSAKLSLIVNLFQFQENGNTIIYSPAFDLSGYGKSITKAKESFEITIGEFLNYTIHKKTLAKELKRLGWKVNSEDIKQGRLKTPVLADLIQKNDYLAKILNEKEFIKFDQTVSVPC